MTRTLLLLGALALIVGAPFALKPKENLILKADRTLVIITPHNEAIRHEFALAFRQYFRQRTGQSVRIDWRVPGGTSEIARYLSSEYETAFANYWTGKLGRSWNAEVKDSFANSKVVPGPDPAKDTPAEAARRAFLESNVGIGIDLFFGGGSFDFQQQAQAGRLIDCGVLQRHPEWFGPEAIPRQLGGEPLWDPKGRWVGTVLAGYGIFSNLDLLSRLGVKTPPAQWLDLGEPIYRRQLALADPTKSGAAAKVYEMVVQQLMQQRLTALERDKSEQDDDRAGSERELRARDEGWRDAMQLFIRLGGNARYFSDSSQKPPIDVADGDAAVAMGIDFYSRQMAGSLPDAGGKPRVAFVTPAAGTSFGTDSIGLLRGAPEADLAREFIDFVLSVDAQKLWAFRVGTPGGPVKYALRRLPILPELYAPEFQVQLSDPGVNPYEESKHFQYRPEWTERLFRPLSFIIRVMCQDPHDELKEAWAEMVHANFPPEAMLVMLDISAVDYESTDNRIRKALSSSDKIEEVRLAKELSAHFREQYRRAAALARAGK